MALKPSESGILALAAAGVFGFLLLQELNKGSTTPPSLVHITSASVIAGVLVIKGSGFGLFESPLNLIFGSITQPSDPPQTVPWASEDDSTINVPVTPSPDTFTVRVESAKGVSNTVNFKGE